MSIRIESIVVTDADFDEWLALFANRNEIAVEYAKLIRQNGTVWDGFRPINQAIIRRWSMSALVYVKERAWKIVRAGEEAGS